MSILSLLHDSFIKPFQNLALSKAYIAVILCVAGGTGLSLFLSFDYADSGLVSVMTFLLVRYGFANLFLLPVSFNLLKFIKFKTYCLFIIPLQIAILAWFFLVGVPDSPLAVSAMLTIVDAPFWIGFHIAMLLNTTDDNRGNEVTLSDAGITIGMVAGTLLGGFALQLGFGSWVVIAGGLTSFAGWAVVVWLLLDLEKQGPLMPPQEGKRSEIDVFRTDPARAIGSVMEGIFQTVTGIVMPVFLKFLGAGGALTGLLQASSAVLKVVMSPVTGYLVNEGKGRDATAGALLKVVGWAPWIFIKTPWLVLFSSLFWTAGAHLFSNGLLSRWYERGNLSTLSLREVMLGVGRCIAIAIALPLLFYSIEAFVFFSVGICVALYITSRIIRNKIQRFKEMPVQETGIENTL